METVGVGQSELDVARAADTTVVVLVPESGDSIQAMKAGLMEIADFFVINKADRAGAEQAAMSIKMVLNFRPPGGGWMPDVLQTVASDGRGVERVKEMIAAHRAHLDTHHLLLRKREVRITERIRELVGEHLRVEFWNDERTRLLTERLPKVLERASTPYDLAEELLHTFKH
jgi:LAO/AO transport system kinase